jgi:hypothetical protein
VGSARGREVRTRVVTDCASTALAALALLQRTPLYAAQLFPRAITVYAPSRAYVSAAAAARVERLVASGRAANRLRAPDSPTPLRVGEDGMPIFSEAALGIGAPDGGTKDCPFDCSCCFG